MGVMAEQARVCVCVCVFLREFLLVVKNQVRFPDVR